MRAKLRWAEAEGAGRAIGTHAVATVLREGREREAGTGPGVRYASFIPGTVKRPLRWPPL